MVGLLGLPGCARIPGQAEPLTIATSWPAPERQELAVAFGRWLKGQQGEPTSAVRLEWLVLDQGTPVSRVVRPPRGRWDPRPGSPAIVLGGPASDYQRMAQLGQLATTEESERPAWRVVRRAAIGWALVPGQAGEPGTRQSAPRRPDGPVTFDDPRHDPVALAWAKGELGSGPWADGYARLVREAAGPRRIGRRAGSSLAAVENLEASATPVVDLAGRLGAVVYVPTPHPAEWVEGAAIVAGHARDRRAQLFFRFLTESGQADQPSDTDFEVPETDALLADLLGATLVDAQDELWTAWASLNRAGKPPRAAMWLTQAPPWPPASIEKLEGEPSGVALVQTLVEQIVPDPDLRAWLLRSWLGTKRQVDGPLLAELAQAVDGRLAQEPRFRAWLRAEWTAWARQRYRRVTRSVEGLKP